MKVLIAVKRVADHSIKVRSKTDGKSVDLTNVKMSINPFDEIALEEAVQLHEQGKIKEIVAVSCGTTACQDVLRIAMAIGAHRGILINTGYNEMQPLIVAKLLKALINQEKPQLVLLGKQAIDNECNQVGQMLAALLDWPQATCASRIDLQATNVVVTREIDGGLETINVILPAVITTDLCMNEPRYVTLQNIIRAKKKSIDILTPHELGINSIVTNIKILKVFEPPKRSAGIKVSNVSALVSKLKNEEKVI